jgi:hypothetical protein
MGLPDVAVFDALAEVSQTLLLELEDSVAVERLNIRVFHSALPIAVAGGRRLWALLIFLLFDY